MELNTIHNADALTGMRALLSHGIKADLILTDPPYELTDLKAGGHTELAAKVQNVMDQLDTPTLRKTMSRRLCCPYQQKTPLQNNQKSLL